MTTAELDIRPQPPAIPAKIAYARALAESGLLPASYRKNPANVLWAAEYGDMLGLSPMAAITGVHVIDGKPTASAGLISALVRRAGHKLRVSGTNKQATCVIVRSDDPGHPFSVTWTLRKDGDNPSAEEAGLLSKDVWKKYPASMLKSRAITQCARDACEEALFGLHYTAEELGAAVDEDGIPLAVRPAEDDPPPQEPEADDRPWYPRALDRGNTFRSEAEGFALIREADAARTNGEATPKQHDHVVNLVIKRIRERRREASGRLLNQLSEADEWRDKVEGLVDGDDEAAREALEELGRLKGAGTMDETRAGRIARAIAARFPKAVLKAADGDA